MTGEGFLTYLRLGGATKGSTFSEGNPPPVPAMHLSHIFECICVGTLAQ